MNMCRDTVIFLLQNLGFVINWKKSVLTPVLEIEYLGLKINSVNPEPSPTEEKIQNAKTKCQNLLTEPKALILELTKVIGLLTSTVQEVLPARLQCRYPQLQKISSLKESHSYSKSRSLQRPIINSASCTVSHTDRGLIKGLGSNLGWYINRETVVSPGNEIPHQYPRVISSKTSNTYIHKIQGYQSNISSRRQHCDLNKFDENEGFSKSEIRRGSQRNS